MSSITSVCYSYDGRRIVYSSFDGLVKILDGKTGSLIKQLPYQFTEFGEADLAVFSHDNNYIASVHRKNNVINIWDLKKDQLVTTIENQNESIRTIAFSPKDDLLVIGCKQGTIIVWDLLKNKEMLRLQDERILDLAVSPDGKRLLSASVSADIKVFDLNSGKIIAKLEGHSGCVSSVQYNKKGTIIISGSCDSWIKFWDNNYKRRGEIGLTP